MDDYLNINLKSLIEKVHNEGIEKAKVEAEHIIDEAKQESAQLMKETEQRIAKMEEKSLNKMNRKVFSLCPFHLLLLQPYLLWGQYLLWPPMLPSGRGKFAPMVLQKLHQVMMCLERR